MAIKKKKNYREVLYELQKQAVTNNVKVSNDDLVKEAQKKALKTDMSPVSKLNISMTTNPRIRETQRLSQSSGKKKDTFFSAGAFDDGYDFGDLTKTILGTTGDIGLGVVKGVAKLGEGLGDLGVYGVAQVGDWLGYDEWADSRRKAASVSLTDKITAPLDNILDRNSVIGERGDSISEGLGYVAGIIATGGAGASAGLSGAGATVLTSGVTGLSSMGSGMGEAYLGGATDEEAAKYGAIKGAGDAITELLFGGLGKSLNILGLGRGLSSADDMLAKKISSKFSSQIAKNFVEYGIKAGAEGTEEVLAGIVSAAGKKATYMSEEDFSKILEDEQLLDQFIAGAITSGIAQSGLVPSMKQGSLIEANKTGRDFISGYTQNEQSVIDKEVENRVKEAEKNGTKLTNKQKNEIIHEVQEDFNKGYVSTDTIESTLGGDTYTQLQSIRDNKTSIEQEISELENKPYAEMTVKENERLKALREELGTIDTNTLENQLHSEIGQKISSDDYLKNTYAEKAKRGQQFTYDSSKVTNEYEKAVYDSASRVMNDTRRTHEFVEPVAKIAKDRGIAYEFTNNAELESSKYNVKGKIIDGLVAVEQDGKQKILINVDSPKALNTVVGHETTHLLEGLDTEYKDLQSTIFELAKQKGEYEARRTKIEQLYEGVDNADIDSELTADLVGDYLFTDADFINNLSTQKPTLFQKIKDLIDDLIVRFKGTKEERQLREVQKRFKEAYRKNAKVSTDTKYSVSDGKIQGLESYSIDEIKQLSKDYIQQKLEESDLYDVYIKDIAIHGSRGRGTAKVDSDLDIVVEYEGDIREDDLFGVLNEDPMFIEDIQVDINPITESLNDYMERSNEYDKGVIARGGAKYSISDNTEIYNRLKKEKVLVHTTNTLSEMMDSGSIHGDSFSVAAYDYGSKLRFYGQQVIKFKPEILDYANEMYNGDGGTRRGQFTSENQKKFNSIEELLENHPKFYDEITFKGEIPLDLIEEVAIPKNSSQELISKLENAGIKVNYYNAMPSYNTTKNVQYSLSEKGTLQDSNGNDVTLETSETGTHGTLMAIHNLNADKLKGIIELGGFPVPSIAVTNPELINHSQFGGVSVLFDKSTIDPANYKNEVYDRDIWSPTFPRVEYDINGDEIRKYITKNLDLSNRNGIISHAQLNYMYSENLSDQLERYGKEELLEKIKKDKEMKYLYKKLVEQGEYTEPTKSEKYSRDYSNESLKRFINSVGDLGGMELPDFYYHYLNYGDMQLTEDQTKALKNTVRDAILPEIREEAEKWATKRERTPAENAQLIEEYIDANLESFDNSYFKYKDFIKDASRLYEFGERNIIDEDATLNEIGEKINQEEYEKWVDSTFGELLNNAKKGIRNDKDPFTPSGNRRSFKQLHDDYNLSNVVKLLTKKDTVASQEGFGAGSNFGTLQAKMANKFNSIEEIKQSEDRLQFNEDTKALVDGYSERIYGYMSDLREYNYNKESSYYYGDNAGYALNDFADYKTQNIANLKKALENNGINSKEVPNELLEAIVKDINELKYIPTDYFEAKPQRAVGLDEVQAIVIPNDASAEFKQLLQDNGLRYYEYDRTIEGDRQRVINQFDDLKFSLSNPNEQIAPTGNYNVYGEDVKLQQAIAPLQEEIQTLTETVTELKEQLAPVKEQVEYTQPTKAELDNLMSLQETGGTEYANTFFGLRDKYGQRNLYKGIEQYKKAPDTYEAPIKGDEFAPVTEEQLPMLEEFYEESFRNIDEANIPQTEGYAGYDNFDLSILDADSRELIRDYTGNDTRKTNKLYKDMAAATDIDAAIEVLEDYRDIYEEDVERKEVKKMIRDTKLDVSHIKNQITDYNAFRKSNFGKLRLGNGGLQIDAFYQELANMYPQYFDPEVVNPADQLEALTDFMNSDNSYIVDSIPQETLENDAAKLFNTIKLNEAEKYYQDILQDDAIAPVENVENSVDNVSNSNIPERIAPVKEEYLAITPEKEPRLKRVKDEPTYNQIAEVLVNEPKTESDRNKRKWAIFKANILDKGAVFEDLSLKENNRELMGKWDYTLTSEARGQYVIGNGHNGLSKSLNDIRAEVENTGLTKDFYNYMYHKHNVDRMSLATRFEGMENKPVFGDSVTAEQSQAIVNQYEKAHPEFMDFAQDVYDYVNADKQQLVDNGVISQETADLWSEMYPHYVPTRRTTDTGMDINVPLDTRRTGINAPIKKATGGSSDILPLFDTMAMRTLQTYKATAKNSFGVELMNTMGTTIESAETNVDEVIDSIDAQDGLLQEGKKGKNPTFTVFENGEKVTFEITKDMYDALKPISESSILSKTFLPTNIAGNVHRGLLTEYNPVFMLTNGIKDVQDILLNSQHAARTYAKIPEAYKQMATKGYWYQEYIRNGGERNSYFDNESNTFKTENKGLKKLLDIPPLSTISKLNNFIEMSPRLAEYIASREAGRSIEVSMLDAARVTTNFKAGGAVTKFLNRNGATFLNASVQGAMQQVRNIREAKANGLKGWVNLATKFAMAGLPAILLNNLVWDDDEEYEELSDYVKQNYYVVWKNDDGTFIRIPKGRAVAVIQEGINQIENMATGDDEADFKSFLELTLNNLAPNNPIESNIFSPIVQAATNKTWYGGDLVSSRLQKLPAAEQYDESTDAFSRWLGEKLDISPVKINYVLDQYSGGIGDVFLPMMTPEAESDGDSFMDYAIAPLRSKFTTNSIMNNQNVSDFYDTSDKLTINANKTNATDEDVLSNKYMNSVKAEMNKLYQEKREVQNDTSLSNSEKYQKVLEIQRQINELSKEGLAEYDNVSSNSNYATVGDREYYKRINSEGEVEWTKVDDDEAKDLNSLGMSKGAKNTYFKTKTEINESIKDIDDTDAKKTQVIDSLLDTDLNNKQKAYLYGKYYSSDETLEKVTSSGIAFDNYLTYQKDTLSLESTEAKVEHLYKSKFSDEAKTVLYETSVLSGFDNEDKYKDYKIAKATGVDINSWLSYKKQEFVADKDSDGKSISGSRKEKIVSYINGLDLSVPQKAILIRQEYPSFDDYNYQIINYVGNLDISYEEKVTILEGLDMKVDSNGNVTWE